MHHYYLRMSFQWSEYLTVSEKLYQQAPNEPVTEAYYRSAIGRAYYACHKTGAEYLAQYEGATIPRRGAHDFVKSKFRKLGSNGVRQAKQIYRYLDRLFNTRVWADYDKKRRNAQRQANQAILDARATLNLLKALTAAKASAGQQ